MKKGYMIYREIFANMVYDFIYQKMIGETSATVWCDVLYLTYKISDLVLGYHNNIMIDNITNNYILEEIKERLKP